MMKKVAISFLLVASLPFLVGTTSCGQEAPRGHILTTEDINDLIDSERERMNNAHVMAEAARALGYSEMHTIIMTAKQEYEYSEGIIASYNSMLSERQRAKEKEYPMASQVWNYFEQAGWSAPVIAGIIGNMMAETAGGTLGLNPYVYGAGGYYYGLCQWNKSAFPGVFGTNVEEQCSFLLNTIEQEFDTYGSVYGITYGDFLALGSAYEAGVYFSKVYERGGNHYIRGTYAEEAYVYFTT